MNRFIITCVLAAIFALPVRAQYIGTIRLYDSSVRVEEDSVRVSFKIHIDREGAAWFSGILLTPALTGGKVGTPEAKIVALPDIMVQGKNKYKATERGIRLLGEKGRMDFQRPEKTIRVVKDTETQVDYNYAVPYETWMDSAGLSLYEEIINFRNERQLLVLSIGDKVELPATETAPRTDVASQVKVAPPAESVQTPAEPVAVHHKRILEGEAFIEFPVGRTEIHPELFHNSEELANLRQVLSSIQNSPNITIESLIINSFSSVEGSYDKNERLSYGRSMALKNYIMDNFSLTLSPSQWSVSWEAEDWDGLAKLVEKSNINGKDEILHIISTVPIFGGREAQLMRLKGGAPYRIMLRDMFPQLRRVQYRIEYTVKE